MAIYVTSFAYSYFINNFSNKSVIYGALAGILALFIWLLILSTLLIIGAVIIAAFREGYRDEYFDVRIEKNEDKAGPINKLIKSIKGKVDEK